MIWLLCKITLNNNKILSTWLDIYAPGDDSPRPHGGILLLLSMYVCTYICVYVCPRSVKVFG